MSDLPYKIEDGVFTTLRPCKLSIRAGDGWIEVTEPATYTCMDCARRDQECPHPIPTLPTEKDEEV